MNGMLMARWFLPQQPSGAFIRRYRRIPVFNKHTVTLKAYKNGCMSAFTDYILVNCGLTARFSNNKNYIASETNIYNDTILFTNNSMNTLTGVTPTVMNGY
jgi:hypothetical protein